jgi:hypothetical protein
MLDIDLISTKADGRKSACPKVVGIETVQNLTQIPEWRIPK